MSRRLSLFVLLLTFALAACGGASQPAIPTEEPAAQAVEEPTAEPAAPPTAEPAPPEPTAEAATSAMAEDTPAKAVYAIGDTARLEPFRVSVSDVRVSDELDGNSALDGNQFVLVDLTLENAGAESQDVALLVQMILEDGAGKPYAFDIGATPGAVMELNGEFEPGERVSSTVGFQAPRDAQDLRFVFRTIDAQAMQEAERVAFDINS